VVVAILGNTYYRDWQNIPIPGIFPNGQWRESTVNYTIQENETEYIIGYSGTASFTDWGDEGVSGQASFTTSPPSVQGDLKNEDGYPFELSVFFPTPTPLIIEKKKINFLTTGGKINLNNQMSAVVVLKDEQQKIDEYLDLVNTETYEKGFLAYAYKMINLLDMQDCCIKCCDLAGFLYPLLSNYFTGSNLEVPPIPRPTKN
jgi:hypothetical protein